MKIQHLLFFSLIIIFAFQSCSSTNASATDIPEQQIAQDSIVEKEVGPPFDSLSYNWVDGYLELSWTVLAKVDFELKFDETIGTEIPFPIFSDEVKALNGKPVQIGGYLIPLEETGEESFLILSAFPYSQCFFCGNAGPESVIDVVVKEELGHRRTDTQLTFRGILKVNETDLDFLNYILQEAEVVGE